MECVKRVWNFLAYEDKSVRAWMRTATSRGPATTIIGVFSATALLFLSENLDTDCDDRVDLGIFTLLISSLLSAGQVCENVINLFLAPYFGALADSSYDRRLLLIFSSTIWVSAFFLSSLVLFFEPSLGLLWIFFLCLVTIAIFYELSLVLLFSYLPEVAKSEEQLSALSARNYGIISIVQLCATILLTGVTFLLSDLFENDLPFTTIAHLFVVCWFLYFGVPGLRELPSRKVEKNDKSTNCLAVVLRLKTNLYECKTKYPQIGLYLLGWTLYFAGVASVTLLQIAFVSEVFDYGTAEVGVLGVVLLVSAATGAFLTEPLSKRFRLKSILLVTVLCYSILVILFPFMLQSETVEASNTTTETEAGCTDVAVTDSQPTDLATVLLFVISMMFGACVGIVYPMSTAIFALIIPGGEETIYFGLKSFCAKALAWLPPLVFTLINESTGNIRLAFSSVGIWFALSLPFVYWLDVDQAMRDVEDTLGKRRKRTIMTLAEVMEEETSVVKGIVNPMYSQRESTKVSTIEIEVEP